MPGISNFQDFHKKPDTLINCLKVLKCSSIFDRFQVDLAFGHCYSTYGSNLYNDVIIHLQLEFAVVANGI